MQRAAHLPVIVDSPTAAENHGIARFGHGRQRPVPVDCIGEFGFGHERSGMQFSSSKSTIRLLRTGTLPACLFLLTSCAGQDGVRRADVAAELVSPEVAACRDHLGNAVDPATGELDAGKIRLVNWNLQKNWRQHWQDDLQTLTRQNDLVLVQEASLRQDSINALDASRYWSFAPGFRTRGAISGVLTMSRSKPIAQCSLVSLEPIFRTPKATSVSEYGLTNTDATLVVVNLHAINFSMGLRAFQEQFDQVRQVLETHEGPIILSGDFNTWRKKRTAIVDRVAQSLGLTQLVFADDNRVRFFGNPLDHIYVRGLTLVDSSTEIVKSSDHNPMTITLQL
jgi:endonuclease/exonuclease/phosphatase (EEP) superfamily protein YafD